MTQRFCLFFVAIGLHYGIIGVGRLAFGANQMKPFQFVADAIEFAWTKANGPLSMLVQRHTARWDCDTIPPECMEFDAYWD